MTDKFQHWTDLILAVTGVVFAFFSFKWVMKIFAGPDGRLNVQELKNATAYFFFLGASGYMIYMESVRPPNSDHIFSDIWLFFVLGALLYVLGMDKFFTILQELLKLAIQLRTKQQIPTRDESEK